jgi:hypothetical protein
LDRAVIETVKPLLAPSWRPEAALHIRVRDAVERIELSAQALAITLATTALSSAAASDGQPSFRIVRDIAFARPRNSTVLIRSGVEAPNADRALIRAIVIAHAWMQRLNGGESIAALAKADGLCPIHTARLLPLAYLAPTSPSSWRAVSREP